MACHFGISIVLTSIEVVPASWSAIVQRSPMAVKEVFTSCLELPNKEQQCRREVRTGLKELDSFKKSSTISFRHRNPIKQLSDQSAEDLLSEGIDVTA